MTIDPDTKTMVGSMKGKPDDWRKASFVRDLAAKAGPSEHDHLRRPPPRLSSPSLPSLYPLPPLLSLPLDVPKFSLAWVLNSCNVLCAD